MSNSPAHDIAVLLHDAGVGVLPWGGTGWAVSAHLEPDSPDNAVTVYDTGGLSPDTDELDMMRPSFQIRVRSLSYADAYAKQIQIRDLLILSDPVQASTSVFVGIQMSSDILFIGRDEKNRHLLTANYQSIRTEE